jgi:hypothetical protein
MNPNPLHFLQHHLSRTLPPTLSMPEPAHTAQLMAPLPPHFEQDPIGFNDFALLLEPLSGPSLNRRSLSFVIERKLGSLSVLRIRLLLMRSAPHI